MQKTIITVVGKDTVGIIAKVCTYLASNHINILDTDTEGCSKDLAELRHELHQVGQEIGVNIHIQHEEIFEMMHRI